jgi:dihydroxyacetone kinase
VDVTAEQLRYGRAAIARRIRELDHRIWHKPYRGKAAAKAAVVAELNALRQLEQRLKDAEQSAS